MLYELRSYHATPGKLPAVNDRFQQHTLGLFAKHGIRPIGFWTCAIGPSANLLVYILAWESLAEREHRWNAFATDSEWLAVKAESEKDGVLVERIENMIMTPTAYSAIA